MKVGRPRKNDGLLPKKKRKQNETTIEELSSYPAQDGCNDERVAEEIDEENSCQSSEAKKKSIISALEQFLGTCQKSGTAKAKVLATFTSKGIYDEDERFPLQSISTDTPIGEEKHGTVSSTEIPLRAFLDESIDIQTLQKSVPDSSTTMLGLPSDEGEEEGEADKKMFAEYLKVGSGYLRFNLPKLRKSIQQMTDRRVEEQQRKAILDRQKQRNNSQSQQQQQLLLGGSTGFAAISGNARNTGFTTAQQARLKSNHATLPTSNINSQIMPSFTLQIQPVLNLIQVAKSMARKALAAEFIAERKEDDFGSIYEEDEPGQREETAEYGQSRKSKRDEAILAQQGSRQRFQNEEVRRIAQQQQASNKSGNHTRYGKGQSEYGMAQKKRQKQGLTYYKKSQQIVPLPSQFLRRKAYSEFANSEDQKGDMSQEDVEITLSNEQQIELLKYHKKSKNYHGTAKQFGVSHDEARTIIKQHKAEFKALPSF